MFTVCNVCKEQRLGYKQTLTNAKYCKWQKDIWLNIPTVWVTTVRKRVGLMKN